MRGDSLFPIPVSTSTVCLPVRISNEFSPLVTQFFSSASSLRDHMTLGTTPKNAPPSSGYVPSDKTVSSKSPSVSRCMELVCHSNLIATDLRGFAPITLVRLIRENPCHPWPVLVSPYGATGGHYGDRGSLLAGRGLFIGDRRREAGCAGCDLAHGRTTVHVRTGTGGTVHDASGWRRLCARGLGIVALAQL